MYGLEQGVRSVSRSGGLRGGEGLRGGTLCVVAPSVALRQLPRKRGSYEVGGGGGWRG